MARFTEAGGTYAEAQSRALDAIDRFEAAGVRVPQHGRLREYAKQFEHAVRAIATGQAGRLDLAYLHRALLDVTELSLIADQFATAAPVNGFQYAGSRAMKGGKLLGDEKNQSSARDFQFELFIGAIFRRGGYDVSFEEPDVIVRGSFGDIVIAAKRPRSMDNLPRLFEDADQQIDRSHKHGLIAVDISFLIMPNDLHVPAAANAVRLLNRAVDAFALDTRKNAGLLIRSPRTSGYISYASMLVVDYERPQLVVPRGCTFGRFIAVDDPRMSILMELRKRVTCIA
jgi:hypothetical protein